MTRPRALAVPLPGSTLRAPLVLALMLAVPGTSGCVQPHCTSPLYSEAECRVIAENQRARLRTSVGVELRFQDPEATDDSTWDARGLLEELPDGSVRARVAGAGRFSLSMRAPEDHDVVFPLTVTNVDPEAVLGIGIRGLELQQPLDPSNGSTRTIDVTLAEGQVQWLVGERPCPSRYRLAVTADIQTNPTQFERIIDRLQEESQHSAGIDEPLVGLLIAGDLTEASRDEELDTILELLARVPFPVAVTAGNHDIYRPNRPYYNLSFGPGNHAFDVCGVHVALLDTGSGALARSVQARLPELLHRGDSRFLVVGMHHPPYPGSTGAGWSQEDRAQALLAELAREEADLVVAGHNHALHDFSDVPVGDVTLREIIVGTGGAYQGAGVPRYGYLRLTFDDDAGTMETCFVEVPPVGYAEPPNDPPNGLPYCAPGS
ncbi:metallophosphoesterase family protein [Paraliomyxa miuraensis]|uniref:metallophosphoesterase family protein n=1 Tax=Paraliomyxa miuraensis TaxID=376150 RepID=UPI002253D080|nr:metallophosphoesterase [Paraliomyxa miuraensis]MCX4245093.1 metallophosphoesterase [Paraliomyxa miuraensis]